MTQPPSHAPYRTLKVLLLIGLIGLLGLGSALLTMTFSTSQAPTTTYDRYIQPMVLYNHLQEDLHDLRAHMQAAQAKLGAIAQQGDLDAATFHLRGLEEHKNALAALPADAEEQKLLQQFQAKFVIVRAQTQVAMQLPADQLSDYLRQQRYFLQFDEVAQLIESLSLHLGAKMNTRFIREADEEQTKQIVIFGFLLLGGLTTLLGSIGLHRAANKISQQAYQLAIDPLTQLWNRHQLELDLGQHLARLDHLPRALLYIDLDGFNLINEVCGHDAGDEALQQFGHWLRNAQSPSDRAYRLGGDEFALLCTFTSESSFVETSETLRRQLQQHRFVVQQHVFQLSASIGIVELTPQFISPHQLLQVADAACYTAKTQEKNQIHPYIKHDQAVESRLASGHWIQRLASALDHQDFVLYAQKISPAQQQYKMLHCEVLLRLKDDNGQLVPPARFLPAAEQHQLMPRIDQWVLSQTLLLLGLHADKMDLVHTVSINLSAKSLSDPDFLTTAEQLFKKSLFPCHKICLEITENALINHSAQTQQFIKQLHKLGVKFALDHFGSGITSFGYLQSLPIQYIKIDHQLVQHMMSDEMSLLTVKSINDITHTLQKQTIAENVESPATAAALREVGVDLLQGYAIHEPAPLEDLLTKLLN